MIRSFASLLFLISVFSVAASDLETAEWPSLEKHCVVCHDDDVSKGGLNLHELVEADLSGESTIHQWTRLFNRVHDGEMPPKKEPRPEAGKKSAFLASRLSHFLGSSMPDERLFSLATDGSLSDAKVLAAEVEKLIDEPKSERFVRNFTGQWLHLRRIDETTPDAKLYAAFDELLQVSMS